jgi:hypothetical protein
MNSSHDPMSNVPSAGLNETDRTVDATLRLIANLPVPDGLEDRIHSALRAAPRKASLLAWPLHLDTGWMRTAAAAAIVVIVAGGGWSVYSHVDRPQPAKVIMMPAAGSASGGFSSAGAMRTPTTLNVPVLKHPVKKPSAKAKEGGGCRAERCSPAYRSKRHAAEK